MKRPQGKGAIGPRVDRQDRMRTHCFLLPVNPARAEQKQSGGSFLLGQALKQASTGGRAALAQHSPAC